MTDREQVGRGNECMASADSSSQLFETRIVQEQGDEENAWASSRSPNVYALESLAALIFDSVPPSLSASDFSVSPDASPNVTYRPSNREAVQGDTERDKAAHDNLDSMETQDV